MGALDRRGRAGHLGHGLLAGLPIIVGVQMLRSAINFDIQNVPRTPIHGALEQAGE